MPIVFRYIFAFAFVVACGVLVFVVLLQQGRGAGMGASLGGGASQTLFGSQASNFMTRLTAVMAATYMILALVLAKWPPFGTDTSSDVGDILAPVEIEESAVAAPTVDMLPDEAPPGTPPPALTDTGDEADAPAAEAEPEPDQTDAGPTDPAATPPELTPAEAAAAAVDAEPAAAGP